MKPWPEFQHFSFQYIFVWIWNFSAETGENTTIFPAGMGNFLKENMQMMNSGIIHS